MIWNIFSFILQLLGFVNKKATQIKVDNDATTNEVEVMRSSDKELQDLNEQTKEIDSDAKQIESTDVSDTDSIDGLCNNEDTIARYVSRANSTMPRK